MIKQLASLCLSLILLSGPAAGASDPAPSPDELKRLYVAGNYNDLLPKLSKALAVKGPDAAQYDKFDLLKMKGEASLNTHSKSMAGDAFKQAAAAATKPEDVALAFATAELIRQSNGAFKYQPKTKLSKGDKPDAIDIVDADSRKHALSALETDMAAKVKTKVDAVIAGSSLPTILQAAKDKDLTDLKNVELAASGSTPDTTQMIGDLGARASSLMDGALDKMVEEIKSDVDAVNNRNGSAEPVKGGQLNTAMTISQFQQNMNGIITNARGIQDYATSMKGLFGEGTDLKPVVEKSTEVQTEAKRLLSDSRKAGG